MQIAGYKTSHRDVKYVMGNVVSHTAGTRYGARWVLEIAGNTLSPLSCRPETCTNNTESKL